ncbi:dTMP kinase [Enteractinococcus helveticum]|uniref:dTMP kinase n=1 Tax=Enteractinococcus helveticum TaxID=1837282 RepID=UPI001F231B87|nr:dTMP kinase [Enteractinococcus helveticum]
MTGLFVVFEGADGTGKSTQVDAVSATLRAAGHDVVVTREPGGSVVAEKLRSLVLDPAHEISPITEALIFAAARADHIEKTIAPALAAGQIVISDRFVGSSIAYQSAGRGLSRETIVNINAYATAGLTPDVTVVLDLDESVAGRRRVERAELTDRMESAPEGFQDAVRASFLAQVQAAPERHLVVDAAQTPEAITHQIVTHLSTKYGVCIA